MDIIPGLKGFGTDTRAAYGAANPPEICVVDSLGISTGHPSWDAASYSVGVFKGTLLQCIEGVDTLNGETIDGHIVLPNSGKIIIFEVSGTINQTSDNIYRESSPYTTIAAQTAPSPGINLRNIVLQPRTHDVLIQHIRIRVGDAVIGVTPDNRDGISIAGGNPSHQIHDIVIDHCSICWAIDENMEIYEEGGASTHDITVSNCIVSEGLYDSLHIEGPHSKGIIVGKETENVSLINNLFMSNVDRNPLLQGRSAVVVNNLLYNNKEGWGPSSLYPGITHKSEVAYVGNVAKKGPSSDSNKAIILIGPGQGYPIWPHVYSSKLYVDDNICYSCDSGYVSPCSPDWDAVIDTTTGSWNGFEPIIKVLSAPIWPIGLAAISSTLVENSIITYAGARPAERDAVDTRVVADVSAGTGAIIDTPSDVGGWPVLAENNITLSIPLNPHVDSGDGYTNLEKWLHELAAVVEGTGVTTFVPTTPVPTTTLTTIVPTTTLTTSPPTTAPPALVVQDVVVDFATTPAPTTLYPTTLAPTTAVPELICIKNLKSTIAKEMRLNGNLC